MFTFEFEVLFVVSEELEHTTVLLLAILSSIKSEEVNQFLKTIVIIAVGPLQQAVLDQERLRQRELLFS
jgi:hypothetical protein|tara:strand:+ start:328 stop:534 length:207 start_codon:yes stop_codon:yes gene_type:complete